MKLKISIKCLDSSGRVYIPCLSFTVTWLTVHRGQGFCWVLFELKVFSSVYGTRVWYENLAWQPSRRSILFYVYDYICWTKLAQLLCLHSFCLHCLNGILRTSSHHDVFLCPECQGEVRVRSCTNLKDLPTNFGISGLLDVLAIKECHTAGRKCGT